MCPVEAKQFELDRIVGMIKSKGYQIVSSQFQNDKIVVKVERVFSPETVTTRDLEVTWLTNFLRTFGWVIEMSSFPENKIECQFYKEVKG